MDVRQLQIFAQVAKHLNFSKAADSLYIAQSAISIAVKKLEQELDTPLFNRGQRKVSLTHEGHALLAHAEKILAQMAEAKLELQELKDIQRGSIFIAMPAMYAAYYFPHIISEFMALHSGLKVLVKEEGTREIAKELLNGTVDLGVVTLDNLPDELEVLPLVDEEMVVCASPSHPFAKLKSIQAKQFFTQPLILVREGYFLRESVDQMAEACNTEANIVFETNLMLLIKKLVLNNIGISTCLRFVLQDDTQLKGIPFDPPTLLRFGLAWRKDRYLSSANRAFIDFLRNQTLQTI